MISRWMASRVRQAVEVKRSFTGSTRRRYLVGVTLMVVVAYSGPGADAGTSGGDPAAGRVVIERSGCLACHSVNGNGEGSARDLAFRSVFHRQSPAETAAVMWNHAPKMWESMGDGDAVAVSVSASDAEDVFAYFRSVRYFDLRGEVIQGKKVFSEKGCASCHHFDSRAGRTTDAPPISEWDTLFDTAAWTSSLWNHAGTMFEEMERSGKAWPNLSEQEMVDLLLYLRTTVERTRPIHELTISERSSGKTVFNSRGCVDCHTLGESTPGKVDLAETARNARTMSGLAAAMWNHIPEMYGKKAETNGHLDSLTPAQVASLASFFYSEGAFSEHGDISRGKMIFKKKDCVACHTNGPPPLTPIDARRFNAPTMMSSVWTHGPSMLDEMENRGLDWPEFSEREMEDLIAYLNDGHRVRVAESKGASEWVPAEESGR